MVTYNIQGVMRAGTVIVIVIIIIIFIQISEPKSLPVSLPCFCFAVFLRWPWRLFWMLYSEPDDSCDHRKGLIAGDWAGMTGMTRAYLYERCAIEFLTLHTLAQPTYMIMMIRQVVT